MNRPSTLAADPEQWYLHYGLDRDPFGDGGVQGLFYPGAARQETAEQLQHLARFSDCVLLVTGVAGSGKTALRRHFVAQSAADTRCCMLEAALLEGAEPWLRRVMSGLGLRSATRGAIDADLQQLVEHCSGRTESGARSWLVIDDAHHLHPEVLQFLPRLLLAAGRHLRVVLFADPAWREALQAVMPPGVPLHTIELQPFERGDTHAYIHYRLNTAGFEGEIPFNPQELERIHSRSAGLPGEINALARQVLLDAVEVVEQPLNSLPLLHFGVIAATLCAMLLLYAWSAMDEGKEPEVVPIPGLAPVEQLEAPEVADRLPDAGLPSEELAPGGLAGSSTVIPGPEPVIEPEEASEPPSGAAGEPLAVAPAPAPEEPAAAPAAVSAPAAASPEPAAQPPAPEAGAAKETDFVYRSGGRIGGAPTADEEAILRMSAGHFALQIMGSDEGAKVRGFVSRAGVKLRVYRKLNNGVEWYSVLYGDYPNRASAERALRNLPPGLSGTKPWIRRVGAVQAEIRKARGL